MAGPKNRRTTELVRPCLNIFPMLDTLCGTYLRGDGGRWYLNGGLHAITGYAGRGNTFKTAFSSYNLITACIRYRAGYTEIYDTEMSYQLQRANQFAKLVRSAQGTSFEDMIRDGSFNIVSSVELAGDEWWRILVDEYKTRRSEKNGMRETVFKNFDGSPRMMLDPWLFLVDSMTMLKTSNILDLEAKNDAGESGLNVAAMRGAGAKSQIISQMPMITAGAGYFVNMVAHAGDEIKLSEYAPSHKKLAGLKGDIKLKGVSENFTFLTNNCFIATASSPLLNKGDKMPEYGISGITPKKGDIDLMIIRFEQLRGKGGPTGSVLDLIFSQREGLQSELSQFYYINKTIDSFGLDVIGNNAKFKLQLYPEVTFTRNNIREYIENDAKFRRALEITYELGYLIYNNHHLFPELNMDMKEMIEGLVEHGYEIDKILTDSVYYWTFKDQKLREVTLTVPTLLEMAKGIFVDKELAKVKPLPVAA